MNMEDPQHLEFDFHEAPRLLEAASNSTADTLTDTEIIQQTCAVYGSIFAAMFTVFIFVRPRYPHVYNLKKSFSAFNTPVAEDAFGRVSWAWKVFGVSYEDLRDQCGMDAMSTIRLLEFGAKLSLVGVFNSLFLMPVYSTGDVVASGSKPDPVKEVSLSNLAQGHHATISCTLAAYILFGAAMYFIHEDFKWFLTHRHNFLSNKRVQNYSVFLSNLPPEMQSSTALLEYFESMGAVVDVQLALDVRKLEKSVAKRDALIPKLEHAINVLTVKGETPTHKINKTLKLCGGEKVDSVPQYSKDLEEMNKDIQTRREEIGAMCRERESQISSGDIETGVEVAAVQTPTTPGESSDNEDPDQGRPKLDIGNSFNDIATTTTTALKTIITGGDDGAPRNAAFITFSDLGSANIARQTVQQPVPWSCVPSEPPMPEFVNWKNIGLSNKSKQTGELISLLLTTSLCIFWTIPVSFVASLSNVDGLTELLPFLKQPVEDYKWFSNLLALLAPFLLVAFINLLPTFILMIIKFEGLIEVETLQHPSLFFKLAIFTIVQTFFISTIASTLFSSLQAIMKDPKLVFTLLAQALPAQAAYFIQIIMVQNLLALGLELLRVSPVAINLIRRILANKLGYNLTEKERTATFLGLRPLHEPTEYYYGQELGSKTILVQMVLFVYGCMTPITVYFTLLVFGLLAIGGRHQFIYIYPPAHDSGGKLWINFQQLSVICMMVAEGVLLTVLLLKESFIAAVLLIPLIVGNLLFWLYMKRRHYAVARVLPMGQCAEVDRYNQCEGMTYESFKDAYLQPALSDRSAIYPENYSERFNLNRPVEVEGETQQDVEVDGEAQQSGYNRIESSDPMTSGDAHQPGDIGIESSDPSADKKKHKKHKSKERSPSKERKRKSKQSKKDKRHEENSDGGDDIGEPEQKSKKEPEEKDDIEPVEFEEPRHKAVDP